MIDHGFEGLIASIEETGSTISRGERAVPLLLFIYFRQELGSHFYSFLIISRKRKNVKLGGSKSLTILKGTLSKERMTITR